MAPPTRGDVARGKRPTKADEKACADKEKAYAQGWSDGYDQALDDNGACPYGRQHAFVQTLGERGFPLSDWEFTSLYCSRCGLTIARHTAGTT